MRDPLDGTGLTGRVHVSRQVQVQADAAKLPHAASALKTFHKGVLVEWRKAALSSEMSSIATLNPGTGM